MISLPMFAVVVVFAGLAGALGGGLLAASYFLLGLRTSEGIEAFLEQLAQMRARKRELGRDVKDIRCPCGGRGVF